MKTRERVADLLATLSAAGVADVRSTFEALRDDLAELLAERAADILLHQQSFRSHFEHLPPSVFDDPAVFERSRELDSPFWNLVVEDFRRLAGWIPRQRLARFGEGDAILFFRERLIASLRPALVELQRYGVLPGASKLLSDEYWQTDNLLGLVIRYEGFGQGLTEGLERRFHRDRDALRQEFSYTYHHG